MERATKQQVSRLISLIRYRRPPAEPPRRTFMDVAGIGRRETAISKVLAFFLDPSEGHGMGDLWICSLLAAASSGDESFSPEGVDLSKAACATEVTTSRGKRIDVVVESDGFVLGIENKIGAGLYNDLVEYAEHVAEVAGRGKRPLLMTLTVADEAEATDRHSAACANRGVPLCNVRYSELFGEVKGRMGGAYLAADADWLAFMRDFMRTIEDMEDPMAGIDEELFRFVGDNKGDFEAAVKTLETVAGQQRAQSRALCALIEESGGHARFGFSAPGTYLPSDYGMWCTTYVSAKLRDSKGEVHPAISNSVDDMLIRCWCSRKQDVGMVEDHLAKQDVNAERDSDKSFVVERFPITAPMSELVEEFDLLLEKLVPIIQT